jgi:hypothetical protein
MLERIRTGIFRWLLRKRAAHVTYSHRFVNYASLHSIKILAPIASELEGRGWKKWIQQWRDKGIKVSACYYITHLQSEYYPDDVYFTRKDVSLFYIPRHKGLQEWLSQPADMLLIPARNLSAPLAWAAAHAAAEMRVGPYDEWYHDYFELMVRFPQEDPEQSEIVATFDKYLKMMK